LELGAVNLNVSEGFDYIWGKSRKALKYCYDHHLSDYDWFLKADTDTYVIVENLRYLLTLYDPEIPLALGMRAHRLGQGKDYLQGGAGYVISREGVKRFVEKAFPRPEICREYDWGQDEDMEMGRCLTNVGVVLGDSRDEFGRNRFFQHTPEDYITGKHIHWYPKILKYPDKKGLEALSDTSITFHTLKNESTLYAFEFFIYKLQVFGLNRAFSGSPKPSLPPDLTAVPDQ
ncbi:glycoprotein-N-acetylgalactosamine 3-beta-galactosyltransferase activity protein, partial [Halocaridina rubra]